MSQQDYGQIESSQRQHQDIMLHQTKLEHEYEIHCLEVVHTLGLLPFKDGNQWCYLYGENIQEGISGFGDTVMLACTHFNENLNLQEATKWKKNL